MSHFHFRNVCIYGRLPDYPQHVTHSGLWESVVMTLLTLATVFWAIFKEIGKELVLVFISSQHLTERFGETAENPTQEDPELIRTRLSEAQARSAHKPYSSVN